jgi:hypothetical protein
MPNNTGSITSANAVVTYAQTTLFPIPQQIEGFGPDDIFDVDQIRSIETIMGVDGFLSAGFVYVEVKQNVTLQADSLSNDFFDILWTQMQAAQDVYPLSGVILLPSIGTKFTMTRGFLTGYKPVPDGKRTLQPRRFELTWNRVQPAPM